MLKLVTKRCKGCGICVNFCPKKVLAHSLSSRSITILPVGCRQACTGETAGHMWAALVAATDPAAGHASGCHEGTS